MEMLRGRYVERLLWVDPSVEKISAEPLDKEVAREYIGGAGCGSISSIIGQVQAPNAWILKT